MGGAAGGPAAAAAASQGNAEGGQGFDAFLRA